VSYGLQDAWKFDIGETYSNAQVTQKCKSADWLIMSEIKIRNTSQTANVKVNKLQQTKCQL